MTLFQIDLVPPWFRFWFRDLTKPAQWLLGVPLIAGCLWVTWDSLGQPGAVQAPQNGPEPQRAFWASLIVSVILVVLSELLRPKPDIEDARPAGLGDFKFPTATEGRPVPLIWGRVEIKGPNVVWFGDLVQTAIIETVKTGLWSKEDITKGFRYTLGIQFALCRGPACALLRVRIGEEDAFVGSVNTGDRFDIDDLELLGGDEFGQGGVQMTGDFYGGEINQLVNAYLNTNERQRVAGAITPTAPRYTGTCYIVMRELTSAPPLASNIGGYIGNSTSIKPWSFEIERYPVDFAGQSGGENRIGDDCNPINVIYELLTNVEWGFGFLPSQIDIGAGSSFVDASTSMIVEGNKFSMLLDRQIAASELLNELQRQIDGIVFLDHRTGIWTIQLVRGADDARFGYDPDTIPQFTDEEVKEVKELTRGSWEDTTNQISVKFSKRSDDYKESYAIAQDMANGIILAAGSFIDPVSNPGEISFPGVMDSALASNLAWRELRGQAFPLLRAQFIVNRKFFDLSIGGVFRWTNERLFDEPVVMRASRIDYGTLTKNEMTVTAAQDVFTFAAASMGTPPATGWTPPVEVLVAYPTAEQIAFEAPRGLIVREPSFTGDDQIAKVWCGARRQGGEVGFDIGQRNAVGAPGGSFANAGAATRFVLIGQLDADLDAGTPIPTASFLVNPTPDSQIRIEGVFDDAATLLDLGVDLVQVIKVNDEFMLVSDAGTSGPDVDLQNIYRGVLGTGQANHSAGDDVFLIFVGGNLTSTIFPNANNVDIELRSKTAFSVFAGAVTIFNLSMTQRAMRPYPPPSVFYNGSGTRFNTPALEGDGAGLNGVGFDVDWHGSRFNTTDEVQELLVDNVVDASTEFRVQVRTDPQGGNNLVFDSGWVSGTGPVTPTQAQVINQDAAGTEMDIRIDSRHDVVPLVDLENHTPLTHRVTPTSARSSQFYLGGDLRASDASNTYVVASATVHNVTIGAAYATSDVEISINGGGFTTIIAATGTTGATGVLSISDTIVLRHTVNETPDPNFVEIDDSTSDVAYGAFSA